MSDPNPILVAHLCDESGSLCVWSRLCDGVWVFWQEGSSVYLDVNDEEAWRSFTTDQVSDFSRALPEHWYRLLADEIHPDFVTRFRREYERCVGDNLTCEQMQQKRYKRWQSIFFQSSEAV